MSLLHGDTSPTWRHQHYTVHTDVLAPYGDASPAMMCRPYTEI